MKNKFLILAILFLSGCTITGQHYIRNLTEETVKIILITSSDLNISKEKLPTFKFSNEVKEISHSLYKKFNQEISSEIIDKNKVSILLPSTSVMHIGFGNNTDPFGYDSLIIDKQGKQEVINLHSSPKIKIEGAGLSRYFAYLDIK